MTAGAASAGPAPLPPDAAARRSQVLATIVRAGPAGVSGEAVAAALGCSRTAVHRHVESLRRHGVDIVGTPSGYRLGSGSDPVVADVVRERLQGTVVTSVSWVAETGSTNDDATSAARAGAPEGAVFGADHQLAGRGRGGRRWESAPASGLLFSVLLRPDVGVDRLASLPIVVALALAEQLPAATRIAWPNDLVVDGHKIAGVLCESVLDEHGVQFVVVGIGVNVHAAPELADGRWPVTCLDDHGETRRRSDVLVGVLGSLSRSYRAWRAGQVDLVAAFTPLDAWRGSPVVVDQSGRRSAGTADGIDASGRLRLLHDDGSVSSVSAGEVRLERPQPGQRRRTSASSSTPPHPDRIA